MNKIFFCNNVLKQNKFIRESQYTYKRGNEKITTFQNKGAIYSVLEKAIYSEKTIRELLLKLEQSEIIKIDKLGYKTGSLREFFEENGMKMENFNKFTKDSLTVLNVSGYYNISVNKQKVDCVKKDKLREYLIQNFNFKKIEMEN